MHAQTQCVSGITLQGCVDVFFPLTQQETSAQKLGIFQRATKQGSESGESSTRVLTSSSSVDIYGTPHVFLDFCETAEDLFSYK